MKTAKLLVVCLGITLPYSVRSLAALFKGFHWLKQFTRDGLTIFLFINIPSLICWGSIFLAVSVYRHQKAAWFPVIFGFALPTLVYASLDLSADALNSIALITAPIFSLPLVLIGFLIGVKYDKKMDQTS